MGLRTTLVLCAVFGIAALLSGWRGARRPDLIKGPRLIPWRFLMVLSAAGFLMLAAHLFNLLGVTTGR
jgi:hypothetical protein